MLFNEKVPDGGDGHQNIKNCSPLEVIQATNIFEDLNLSFLPVGEQPTNH